MVGRPGYQEKHQQCSRWASSPGEASAARQVVQITRRSLSSNAWARLWEEASTLQWEGNSSGLQKLPNYQSLNLSPTYIWRSNDWRSLSHACTRRSEHLSLGPIGPERMITEGAVLLTPERVFKRVTAPNYTHWRKEEHPETQALPILKGWIDNRVIIHSTW